MKTSILLPLFQFIWTQCNIRHVLPYYLFLTTFLGWDVIMCVDWEDRDCESPLKLSTSEWLPYAIRTPTFSSERERRSYTRSIAPSPFCNEIITELILNNASTEFNYNRYTNHNKQTWHEQFVEKEKNKQFMVVSTHVAVRRPVAYFWQSTITQVGQVHSIVLLFFPG